MFFRMCFRNRVSYFFVSILHESSFKCFLDDVSGQKKVKGMVLLAVSYANHGLIAMFDPTTDPSIVASLLILPTVNIMVNITLNVAGS